MPTWAPTDTARSERTPNRPLQQRGPGERVSTRPPAVPARSAVQRLMRGVGGAMARGQPGTRARGRAGEGSAACQQVGASFLARARAAHSPSRSPRVASPPRRERAPPALARVSFGLLEPHITRSFCQGRRLRRGSSAAAQPQLLSAASQSNSHSSATPCPFPALLSHRETLDTKLAGLRRGL